VDQQHQSRWRTIGRWFLWTSGIVVALALVISLYGGYRYDWQWTGIGEPDNFPKRTLWDWLQLLIIPAVLALGGYLFTQSENRRTQETADQQRTLDRELADQRRQDDMLQAYLERMSQLLTDKERPLDKAHPGDSVYNAARAQTLAILPGLNGQRKGNVLRFLYESRLLTIDRRYLGLDKEKPLMLDDADLTGVAFRGHVNLGHVNLRLADLSHAHLNHVWLWGAYLKGAKLRDVDLRGVDLHEAELGGVDLSGADLRDANLREASMVGSYPLMGPAWLNNADLTGADLSDATGITNEELEQQAASLEGATMPNGQKYEDWLKSKGRR
jgi:uncharacterized protein YjbI with pentapeptide repeats